MNGISLGAARVLLTAALAGSLWSAAAQAQDRTPEISGYIPTSDGTGVWHLADTVKVYTGDDLYSYIDGGADLYMEYGFRGVASCHYSNAGGASVALELYNMKDDGAAFGVYSLNSSPSGRDIQVGAARGSLREYYLQFWKGPFLVYVIGSDSTRETVAGIRSIALALEERLACSAGSMPALVAHLPQESLLGRKYVRGQVALSSVYNFDDRNIFGLRAGAVGEYPDHSVFLLEYPGVSQAKEWLARALKALKASRRFTHFSRRSGLVTLRDGNDQELCLGRVQSQILIVLGKKGVDALQVFRSALKSIEGPSPGKR